jgi:hypothetical protein
MKVPSGEGSLTGESSEDHQEPRFVAEAGFLFSVTGGVRCSFGRQDAPR